MTRLRHLLILLATVLLLAACSTSRKTAGKTVGTAAADTVWHTLYAPVKINLTSPMTFGASGRATMVRDSLVHISMRFFGMEVAVVRATADSAWVVDRFHKLYTVVPMSALTARTALTLGAVQDIMLGKSGVTGSSVRVSGTGVEQTPAGRVAPQVDFAAKAGRRDVAGTLVWDLSKARWNTPLDAAAPSLAGYEYIEPDRLPAALKGM